MSPDSAPSARQLAVMTVLDGATGAAFLADLKTPIEERLRIVM